MKTKENKQLVKLGKKITKKSSFKISLPKTSKKDEEFSYCIGRPWNSKKPNGSICTYTYGSTIFYGTTKSAEALKEYVERQEKGKKQFIYKLVKIKNEKN